MEIKLSTELSRIYTCVFFVLNYTRVLGVLTGPPLNTLISAHCVEKLKSCEFFGRNNIEMSGLGVLCISLSAKTRFISTEIKLLEYS